MTYVLGAIVVAFLGWLVVGSLLGKVRVTGCCAIADPRRDARMRGAFDEDEPAAGAVGP